VINIAEKEAAELSLTTERGLDDYKDKLRLKDEDLSGKKILDLGSGPTSKFAQDVKKRFPETEVVSLDYSFKGARRTYFEPSLTKEASEGVAGLDRAKGLFTALPFADNSFDVIVSSAAMPLYLNNPKQIEQSFKEVVRVLRKGGKAHIGPVAYTDVISKDPKKEIRETHIKREYQESKNLFTKILDKFKEQIEFEFLPEETTRRLNRYFGDFDTIILKSPVLIITKKN
jgi:ubiquinone/menaquinone biosynthesis C-methylase UbiE